MSAYENVDRQVKTAAKFRAPTSGKMRRKQRKWRVLLSIGLLLSALAAVIGIVAWAISVEVSNSDRAESQALSSSKQHRKLQQARLARPHVSALLRRPQPPEEAPVRQARTPEPEPASGAGEFAGARRRQADAQVKTKSESAGEQQRRSAPSTLLLTNLGQVEALSGSSTSSAASSSDVHEQMASTTSTSTTTSTTTTTTTSPPSTSSSTPGPSTTSSTTVGSAINSDAGAGRQRLSKQTVASLAKQLSVRFQEDPTGLVAQLAGGKEGALMKPGAKVSQVAEELEVAGNRYTLEQQLQAGDSDADSKSESDSSATSAEPTDKTTAASVVAESEAPPTTTNEPLPAATSEPEDNPSAAGSSERSASDGGQDRAERNRQPEDELSFELIASAISTSLNQHSSGESAESQSGTQLALPAASTEGDTGAADTAADAELADGGHVEAAPFQSLRRRTTGEHVAEVIDHIVERRKQAAAALGSSGGSQQRGPQIVVVAPVGDNMKARSLTKAGAPEAGKPSEGSDSKASIKSKLAEERLTKKDAIIATESNKKQQVADTKHKARGSKPLIGGRLLGSGESPAAGGGSQQVESNPKYSERVEVIEDDDSSAFLMKSLVEEQQQEEAKEAEQKPQVEAADETADAISSHVSSHSGEPRSRSPRHELDPRLAFERFAPALERRQQPAGEQPVGQERTQMKLYSAEQLIREHVLKSKSRPKLQPSLPQQSPEPPRQPEHLPPPQPPQPQPPQSQPQPQPHQHQKAGQHQVKVIPTTFRPHAGAASTGAPQDSRQGGSLASELGAGLRAQAELAARRVPVFVQHLAKTPDYQAVESQQQAQAVPYPQAAQASHLYPQEAYHHLAQAPPQQVAAASQQQLPQFADQEFNVPAHMAESVIQNIQRAPPTINMVNGQPTLVSVGAGQVPFQPHHQNQLEQLQQQPTSPQQALYLASQQYQQQQQYHLQQQQAYNQARFAAHDQNPYLQQQQQQRQVIANRNGGEPAALVVPVKRSMIHPVAQMALRHLFSSIGQQQQQDASQTSAQAAAPAAPPVDPLSRSMASQPAAPDASQAAAPEDLQAAGSRQMRSLPAGPEQQQPAESQQQPISDQEVQESYNQGPAYSYGGEGYGGGQGYGYNPGYQSDNDKKSKGVTFHFGGGPIGGGTQLITSPMGIFKHLMLPLLPNPQMNLNGKIVFGVVLEKSTKIGAPPKKKYKFWGR